MLNFLDSIMYWRAIEESNIISFLLVKSDSFHTVPLRRKYRKYTFIPILTLFKKSDLYITFPQTTKSLSPRSIRGGGGSLVFYREVI